MATQDALSAAAAMCACNGERFVPEQLDSVSARTRLPDPLVMVDDASTDRTTELAERRFTHRPGRMHLTLERNTRNVGCVLSFGWAPALGREDVLFLCDQDDVGHPGKIERTVREFALPLDPELLRDYACRGDADGRALGCRVFEALELSASERTEGLEDALIDRRQHGSNPIRGRQRSGRQRLASGNCTRALMQRIEARLEILVGRVEAGESTVSDERRDALRDRARHARACAELRDARDARLRYVLDEAQRGGYRRHSLELRSAIADAVGLH